MRALVSTPLSGALALLITDELPLRLMYCVLPCNPSHQIITAPPSLFRYTVYAHTLIFLISELQWPVCG